MDTTKAEQPNINLQQDLPDGGPKWHRWFRGTDFHPFRRFGIFVAVLCLIFIQPLISLVRLMLKVEIHSHIILIPFICWYLIRIRRDEFPTRWRPAMGWSLTALVAGLAVLVTDWIMLRNGWKPQGSDHLSMIILGFYFLLVSGCCAFWGRDLTRLLLFAVGMMIFIVPMPSVMENGLEVFLQHASAEATDVLLSLSGTPIHRKGLMFEMPNLVIQVAPQCSGSRSTVILFITGLMASHLFLRTPWKQGLFVIATVPLGILRNAFRIFVISMATIHVNPNAINSSLHSDGGPWFFALSLIPLFGLLILLRRSEVSRKAEPVSSSAGK